MTASKLRLIETAEIINLPVREPSSFDAAWACRSGQMKKRGDGSEKTRKLWVKAEKKVGSARLLEALKRYLREEKEPTCGYPGLSVWLNGERYDHWIAEDLGESASSASRPKAPSSIRERALDQLGESFVLSYLDPATFHEDGFITPRTDYAKGKLMEQRHALKAAGILGIRNKEAGI